jgi:hypothetical protein
MEPLVTLALTTLVSAFFGAYLAGYFRKKGENLATHEDIDKLVEQVAAVTTTTKEIEAKISGEVWDKQKRWELKREVLFEATKRVSEIGSSLLMLDSVLQVEVTRENIVNKDLANNWGKYLSKFHDASEAFDETKLFVAAVCGNEANEAFDGFGKFILTIARKISKKDKDAYQNSRAELTAKLIAVHAAIRKELGIEALEGQPSPVP